MLVDGLYFVLVVLETCENGNFFRREDENKYIAVLSASHLAFLKKYAKLLR